MEGEPDRDKRAPIDKEFELELVTIKQKKSRSKAVFTRYVNRLKDSCKDEIESEILKEQLDKVETAMDKYVEDINSIIEILKISQKTEVIQQYLAEIDECEKRYEDVVAEYHTAQLQFKSTKSDTNEFETEKVSIGKDMWKQLQKVKIPNFNGEKENYESWKSAFLSCVDAAPATKEYKLLQLRQCLSGPALKAIEELGHSAKAYDIALERLERKFGGKRRRIHKYLELLESFPQVNQRNMENFADLLDMAIVSMEELDLESELHSGLLYLTVQRKLPQTMLVSFHRWLAENKKDESVQSLKEYVLKETEYSVISNEVKYGFTSTCSQKKQERTFHAVSVKNDQCPMCKGNHRIWECNRFKDMSVSRRWEKTKEMSLCFRCLKGGHQAKKCRNYRKCSENGCTKLHNRLLHTDGQNSCHNLNPEAPEFNVTAHCKTQSSFVALRTVPVIIRSGRKSFKIHAMLDDGSTTSYINTDIASELGLKGTIKMYLLMF